MSAILYLYSWSTSFFLLLIRAFSPFFPKIEASIRGREGCLERWENGVRGLTKPRLLLHVASVGELEQARGAIAAFAKDREVDVLLSYFSPSVEKGTKDFHFAKRADFLPFDTRANMREFFRIVRPDFIVLNRYDLWPNFLREARLAGIKVVLINASTPPQGFWGRLGLLLRAPLYRAISAWTFVDAKAAGEWEAFLHVGVDGVVAGDPRVDRALERTKPSAQGEAALAKVRESWSFESERLIVAGSTWAPDESLLLSTLQELRERPGFQDAKLLLVPHEVDEASTRRIEAMANQHNFRVQVGSRPSTSSKDQEVFIFDAVGALAELYALGKVSYVGGAFGRGVHSVIEPAAHGNPVAFGPRHGRMPEAESMVVLGAALALERPSDAKIFAEWLVQVFRGGSGYQKARDSVGLFIKMHVGAASRVAEFLKLKF
jgi:3-deoxy-D-manno-octulosonic-acid transferase